MSVFDSDDEQVDENELFERFRLRFVVLGVFFLLFAFLVKLFILLNEFKSDLAAFGLGLVAGAEFLEA